MLRSVERASSTAGSRGLVGQHPRSSVAWPAWWSAWFGVVTNRCAVGEGQLQDDTPDVRSEWPMHLTGGTAGVMARFEPQVECPVVQPSAADEYLLGIRVALAAERGRVGPGVKPGQSGVLARDRVVAEGELLGHPLQP